MVITFDVYDMLCTLAGVLSIIYLVFTLIASERFWGLVVKAIVGLFLIVVCVILLYAQVKLEKPFGVSIFLTVIWSIHTYFCIREIVEDLRRRNYL